MTARMQRPGQKARRSSSGGSKSSKESNNRLISAAVNKHQRISKVDKIKPYDILCGRDKNAFSNVGNRRFRVTVNLNLPRYVQATSKNEKSEMILSLVRFLRNDVGARFLQKKGKSYFELDEKQARSKVGHALRDRLVAQEEAARKKSEREDAVSTPPIPDDPVQQKPVARSPESEPKKESDSNQPDSSNPPGEIGAKDSHQYDSNDDDDHSFYTPPPLLNNRALRTHAARQATMIAEQHHHDHNHHHHQRNDDDENRTAPSFATIFDHIPMPESRAAFFQLEDGEGRGEDHVESLLLQNVDTLMNEPTNMMMTNDSNGIFAAEDHHGDINQRLVALLDPHPTSLSYPCPPEPTPDGTAALKRSMDDDLVWDHSMVDPGFLPRLHGKKRQKTAGDETREK